MNSEPLLFYFPAQSLSLCMTLGKASFSLLIKNACFRRSGILWKKLVPGLLSSFSNPSALSLWPMWKGEALLFYLFLKSNIVCRKVFTTPGSLRNHAKIHTGATSCPVCSRQLATVSSLNRHMKSEHRDALDALWSQLKGPLSTNASHC